MDWRESARQRALDGNMAWSEYYTQYYDRMAVLPSDPHKTLEMQAIAELIPSARRYEAGEITKDQFYDIRRITGAKYDAMHQNLSAMERAEARQQAAENAAAWQRVSDSFKPKPTVSCTTTRLPGAYTATTTCQ